MWLVAIFTANVNSGIMLQHHVTYDCNNDSNLDAKYYSETSNIKNSNKLKKNAVQDNRCRATKCHAQDKDRNNNDCIAGDSMIEHINLFVPNALFFYPLQTWEKSKVFWCLQWVEKGCIGWLIASVY